MEKSIVDYLRLPPGDTLDMFGPIIIIFILLSFLFLALRLQVIQDSILARREKIIESKRNFERINVGFKIQLSTMDNSKVYNAEILDVSAGGMRLLAPLYGIGSTLKYKISASNPPLKEITDPTLIVLRMNEGDEPETVILRAKWIHLSLKQRESLAEEIANKSNSQSRKMNGAST